jgi:EAL domain-containing protein (putative c-di-GMP-specific phosphodiesterase class I)
MRRAKFSPKVAQRRCFLPYRRAGLIVDVPEERIISDLALASELAKKLQSFNVQLANYEFGQGHTILARIEKLPFAKLKLARKRVIDCSVDKGNVNMRQSSRTFPLVGASGFEPAPSY